MCLHEQWDMCTMCIDCCAGAVTPWGAAAVAAPAVGGAAVQEEEEEEEAAVPSSESAELRQLRQRHWGNISYRCGQGRVY
jgi:hypothetical protein